jgi:hypothetical protein
MFSTPDLTAFCSDDGQPQFGRLSVGWLPHDDAYSRGPVSPAFLNALRTLARKEHEHRCTICDRSRSAGLTVTPLEVDAPSGVTYVVPDLILHYVEAHEYRPPQDFMEAVVLTQQRRPDGSTRGNAGASFS